MDNAHFDIQIRGLQILKFGIGSLLALMFTLGLAIPLVMHWGYQLFINNMSLVGEIDLESAVQMPSDGSALADDAVMAYDLDFGF